VGLVRLSHSVVSNNRTPLIRELDVNPIQLKKENENAIDKNCTE